MRDLDEGGEGGHVAAPVRGQLRIRGARRLRVLDAGRRAVAVTVEAGPGRYLEEALESGLGIVPPETRRSPGQRRADEGVPGVCSPGIPGSDDRLVQDEGPAGRVLSGETDSG